MKNIGAMMKQVQEMQTRMADMQARLETLTVTGQSGAGLVRVTLSGKGVMMRSVCARTSHTPSSCAYQRPARKKESLDRRHPLGRPVVPEV